MGQRPLWALLAIPPVLASIISYLATKGINNIKEKLVAFWVLWASTASLVHVLLNLNPLLLPSYPLLALFTGFFMYRGLGRLEPKGRPKGSE